MYEDHLFNVSHTGSLILTPEEGIRELTERLSQGTAERPVKLLELAPCTNLAEALSRRE